MKKESNIYALDMKGQSVRDNNHILRDNNHTLSA